LAASTQTRSKEEQALACVTNHAWGNAAIGLIPIPVLDLVALTGVQVKMIAGLAKIYDLDFKPDRARSLVVALLGSLGSLTVAGGIFLSVLKFVPFLGVQASVVTLPAVAGAVTYAVGKVFISHFEAGGTLLDLDPQKMKKYFQEQYAHGLQTARSKGKK